MAVMDVDTPELVEQELLIDPPFAASNEGLVAGRRRKVYTVVASLLAVAAITIAFSGGLGTATTSMSSVGRSPFFFGLDDDESFKYLSTACQEAFGKLEKLAGKDEDETLECKEDQMQCTMSFDKGDAPPHQLCFPGRDKCNPENIEKELQSKVDAQVKENKMPAETKAKVECPLAPKKKKTATVKTNRCHIWAPHVKKASTR